MEQKGRPTLVRFRLRNVLPTIELHDRPPLGATEISNAPSDDMLTPELGPAHLSASQPCPELTLSIGLIPT